MKILVDVLGGDNAPEAVLDGIAEAKKADPSLELVLVGPEEIIRSGLEKRKCDCSDMEIINATEMVLNTDHPALFTKTKPNCTMAICFENLRKRDDVAGMVSAGPTGALLTGSILRVGRMKGVDRPCLMATIPTRKGTLCRIVDAGANMDSKPEYLVQFAIMCDTYLKLLGIESPRVATLSVGQEEGKGNELSKTVYNILKESDLNFVGNIEGDHVLKGEADIVVTDGFAGNVFLKSLEEAAFYVSDMFKAAIYKNVFSKFGALFMLKGLKGVKKPFDMANRASAPMLGVKKLVCKCHGKSKGEAFATTILETQQMAKSGLIDKMQEALINIESKKQGETENA